MNQAMQKELAAAGLVFQDKTLTCCDCKQTFNFAAGEQKFFAEHQLSDPRRCKPCREIKKAKRGEA